MVKQLREKTGAGMMDCKKALAECDGDIEKAIDFLRKKGITTAQKRAGRATSEGIVQSYIHMGGKIGVMVEVNCESDFVAKNEEFVEFAKNIAMHIAATNPVAIAPEDVPASGYRKGDGNLHGAGSSKWASRRTCSKRSPKAKLAKFYKESCLLNQAYVRDPNLTITDLLNEMIAKIGENISIRRFCTLSR